MAKARVRSPRCPSISLEEALAKADSFYEKEGRHAVATDVAAQAIGYKDAGSGRARSMLATLAYYGLTERQQRKIAISESYEKYKFSPDEKIKFEHIDYWLKSPTIFKDLIEKYGDNLPSDAALKYELIEMGFKPEGADDALSVFKASLEFVNSKFNTPSLHDEDTNQKYSKDNDGISRKSQEATEPSVKMPSPQDKKNVPQQNDQTVKPIPIFLPNNREALLYLPRPLYKKDIQAIKMQIEAFLSAIPTDDEE